MGTKESVNWDTTTKESTKKQLSGCKCLILDNRDNGSRLKIWLNEIDTMKSDI